MKKERAALPVVILVCIVCCLCAVLLPRTGIDRGEETETLRIGLVLNGDESTSYSANFIQALSRIKAKYKDQVAVNIRRNVAEEDLSTVVKSLVEDGCGMIVLSSYGYENDAKEAAAQYPGVQFIQATGDNAGTEPLLDNYHTFMGRIAEGRYVAGQVAGRKLQALLSDGSIREEQAIAGYVGAFPNPEVISGFTAFYLGVRDQCPSAIMKVVYTNAWNDYDSEFEAAGKLIRAGCVVVSQHSDTEGPAAACEEAHRNHVVYHAGYNQNMSDVAPTTSLISTRIDWYGYLYEAVGAVLDHRKIEDTIRAVTHGNDAQAGFDRDWVQMLPLNEPIAADGTEEMIEESVQEFRDGKAVIFQGDYHGTDPQNPSDTIDLKDGYQENADASAPSFHYILDGITIL